MNETEIEIIKSVKKELKKKKKRSQYDKGQLDLIKKLRKKPKTKMWEKVLPFIGIGIGIFSIFALSYFIYLNIKDGSFAAQFASERWAKSQENEQSCCSRMMDNDTFVAFIKYDCTPINKITKGIQNCKGEYYVFLNKINGKWVVNESTKSVIW